MNSNSDHRPLVFHPIIVLICAIAGALLYALWSSWHLSGAALTNQYVYMVPIAVPFIAFLFDRASEIREAGPFAFAIDVLVVGAAMMRMIGGMPFVSGHALFLSYAMMRPGSAATRVTAMLVLLEVIYLKFFVWHDLVTPLTGLALGVVAALITRRLSRNALWRKPEPAI